MRLPSPHGRRAGLGFGAVLLAAGLLVGCGAADTGLHREAARQLQARVLEVTEASSQNNPAAALKALEGLETELEAAQAKGRISEERRRSITTIATAVRADLSDAVAAAEKAAADKAAADKAAEEERIAKETAAPQATTPALQAPAPAPVPAPEGSNSKRDNEGKGKGNG